MLVSKEYNCEDWFFSDFLFFLGEIFFRGEFSGVLGKFFFFVFFFGDLFFLGDFNGRRRILLEYFIFGVLIFRFNFFEGERLEGLFVGFKYEEFFDGEVLECVESLWFICMCNFFFKLGVYRLDVESFKEDFLLLELGEGVYEVESILMFGVL